MVLWWCGAMAQAGAFRGTVQGPAWTWGVAFATGVALATTAQTAWRPVWAAAAAPETDAVLEERSGFHFPRRLRLDASTDGTEEHKTLSLPRSSST